jgi:hypothetical protein
LSTKELITGRTVVDFTEESFDETGSWYNLILDNGLQLAVQAGWVWIFPKED